MDKLDKVHTFYLIKFGNFTKKLILILHKYTRKLDKSVTLEVYLLYKKAYILPEKELEYTLLLFISTFIFIANSSGS